jgi:hypothetical protein
MYDPGWSEPGDETAAKAVHPPGDNVLRGFPLAKRTRGKTRFPGGIGRRWHFPDGKFCDWNYERGAVEMYDRRGRHRGEFDPDAGAQIGPAVPGARRSHDDGIDL